MKCSEFEGACNDLFDAGLPVITQAAIDGHVEDHPGADKVVSAGDPAATVLQRLVLDHAAACPACRRVAGRYEALRLAIHACRPPAAAPDDFADRVLAALTVSPIAMPLGHTGTPRTNRFWHVRLPLAALAASALAALTVGLLLPKWTIEKTPGNHPEPQVARNDNMPRSEPGSADLMALNDALAGAADATWDLARTASEPAARFSRQVLDAASGPEPRASLPVLALDAGTVSSLSALAPDSESAVAMLQKVGDRLATEARPLSTTARHAFGFLLTPSLSRPENRPNTRAAKGT
jgi:hypothetical protein